MRELKITALLLLLTSVVFSQITNLDSLKMAAENRSGLEKARALNALSEALMPKNPDLAKAHAEMALGLASGADDQEVKAAAYDNIGRGFQVKLDYRRAMESFLEALKIRVHGNDERGQAVSRSHMGRVFYLMEDFTLAEENLVKALDLWKKIDDGTGAAQAHEFLGDLYLAREIYGIALENYRQAMDLKLGAGDAEGAAGIASLLGDIYMELGNGESAISYFRTSLDLNRELNDSANIATDYNRISMAQLDRRAFEEALEFSNLALGIRRQMLDTFGMAECGKNLGLIYLGMKELERAKAHLQKSAEWLVGLPVQAGTPDIYRQIAEGFAAVGDFDRAYSHHLAFAQTRTEVFNQEKAKALLELTTKYESEFAAREQQQRIEILELEKINSAKIKYFLLVVIGLIGVLLATVYFSYRRKKADNQLLLAKNEEIGRQKDEIKSKNTELQQKNISLDLLNKKLVDEMAERENIEKSSFARDRFLATMSHEMRTPLNIIIGLTHILLDSEPRPDQAEQLRTLQYSANNLIVYINDVLDFSKIEAGKLNLEDREFNPITTFQEIKFHFEKKAAGKNLLFHYFFDKKIPEKLLGDNARLHQILTYLLTNMLQHTEAGAVKTQVSLEGLNNREAMLKIAIEGTDGGHGRKIMDGLFQSLGEQGGETVSSDSEQLSLAITKRLIELQNGKLEVVTLPGTSTTFVIFLPFKLVAGDKKSVEKQPVPDFSHLAGTSILVVEDNKINQLVVAKILRKLGIEVRTANHGQEALEFYENEDFDLILMDIQMPVMDGYRTTAEIRTHPIVSKRDVPIIALTASAFLTEKEKAVLFGMNDHVGKPFSPEELLSKISACLEVYRNA